ncbi:MAG: DUF4920 domain-containing protein [Flavobacteriales bacterium]|nr:MAG: DUF4920 domain-containing protein [Flavobacteriales bacterium]
MKKILFIACTTLLFACGNTEDPVVEVAETTEEATEEVTITETMHGEEITDDGALTTVEFLDKFDSNGSSELKLTAYATEVCAKKGCWMVLELDNEQTMRVTFKDYGFFVPKDAAGKLVTVKGIAKMDTTDVATLQHYAEDANASQEEIDAITEPEYNYAFEATGVIIKEVNTLEE